MKTIDWGKHRIAIERPKGFVHTVQSRSGPVPYEYLVDYGYFEGTIDGDGEPLDVFLGPDPDGAQYTWICSKGTAPDFDKHEEYKVMLGFAKLSDAIAALGPAINVFISMERRDRQQLHNFIEERTPDSGCNLHDDCTKADASVAAKGGRRDRMGNLCMHAFHCSTEDCEDCFGC